MTESHDMSNNNFKVCRLFVLDLSGGHIFSVNTGGSDQKIILTGCRHPDVIAVDIEASNIYLSNMGGPNLNDGSRERVNLDGRNRTIIVTEGYTFTPKQVYLNKKKGKLYLADREWMRILRSNLNGSKIETLVQTGEGETDRDNAINCCVGITADVDDKRIYWTQKGPENGGGGANPPRQYRNTKRSKRSQAHSDRVLFDGLPESIDLNLDLKSHMLYWSDRGVTPQGST